LEIWIWSGYYTSSGFRRKSHSYKVKLKVNKIAARWPAKAVTQFFTFSKKGSDRIIPR